MSRLLDLAASQGKLDELAAQVDAARKAVPGWTAGDVLRALIDCRLGRYDQATAAVRRFLDQTKDEALSSTIYWVIGAELEDHAPTRELAVTAYEASLDRDGDDPYNRLDFDNGPAKRLVNLYRARSTARRRTPRLARLRQGRHVSLTPTTRPATSSRCGCSALGTAAAKLHELGFAADAVSFYSQSLALAREIPAGAPNVQRQYRGNGPPVSRRPDPRPRGLEARRHGGRLDPSALGLQGSRIPEFPIPEGRIRKARPEADRQGCDQSQGRSRTRSST